MGKALALTLTTIVAMVVWITTCCDGAEPTPDARRSTGEAAIKQAAAANKHLYIFFYVKDDEPTQAARKRFEAEMAKLEDVAQWIAIKTGAPGEKALVEGFNLQVLSILVLAPNGIVTTAFPAQDMNEESLRAGIASPCQQTCLKALLDGKFVVLCAYGKDVPADDPTVKAVNEFQADAANAKSVEVVRVDPADAAEARFLKQSSIDPKRGLNTVVFGPPRALLGQFFGPVTKESLAAVLKPSGAG